MDRNLGYKIKKMRELKGFKQEYMANGLGIGQGSYSDIEAGKTEITIERFKKIAELLETTPQSIENFDDKVVFNIQNNNNAIGSYITIQNASVEELTKVLIDPYKQQIAKLEDEIAFLRSLLKQQEGKQ